MGNVQRDNIINAAKLGSTDELKAMLSKLSRDDKKAGRCYDEPGEGGQSALHKAAEYGWLPCVELLVDAGAQKQRLDEQGRTPLFVAADAGHAEVVEYLLKKGSDADYKFCSIPDGKMKKLDAEVTRETPLLRASAKGNLEVVKKLCRGGADVNVRVIDSKLFFGTTALMQAAKNNRIEVVRYLVINAEAKVNAVNNDGSSALHLAAYAGYEDVVVLLCNRGADPEMRNGVRETANDMARRGNCNAVAKYLSNLTPAVRLQMAAKFEAERRLEDRQKKEAAEDGPLKPRKKSQVVVEETPAPTAEGGTGDAPGTGGGLVDALQKSMSQFGGGIAMLPGLRRKSSADGDGDGHVDGSEKDPAKATATPTPRPGLLTQMVARLPMSLMGSTAPSRAPSPRLPVLPSAANSGAATPLHGSGGGDTMPLLQKAASILTQSRNKLGGDDDDNGGIGGKTRSGPTAAATDATADADDDPFSRPASGNRRESNFDLFDSTAASATNGAKARSRANSASKRGFTADFVVEGLTSPTGGKATATAAKIDALKTMLDSTDGKKRAPDSARTAAGGNGGSDKDKAPTTNPTRHSKKVKSESAGGALPPMPTPRSGTATPTEQEPLTARRARPSVAAVGLPVVVKK